MATYGDPSEPVPTHLVGDKVATSGDSPGGPPIASYKPRLLWLVVAWLALASVVQPLQQCGTFRWVVILGWALGWLMLPVACAFIALLIRGSKRERVSAAIALILILLYGQAVMWGAVWLCRRS